MASTPIKHAIKPIIHRTSTSHKKSLSLVRAFSKGKSDLELYTSLGRNVKSAMVLVEDHSEEKVDSKAAVRLTPFGPNKVDNFKQPQKFEHSESSAGVLAPLRSLFRNKVYKFRLSTALNMSSSGAGIVNSTINMSVVQSSTDYSALSGVFQEFFIVRCDVKWMPASRYQYPLGGTSTLSVANLPIGCAQLLGSAPVYSSMSSMTNNHSYKHASTGDPFDYSWINDNNPLSGMPNPSSTLTTQAWCDTVNGQAYTGALQFLSQSSPPALPFSQVLGTFATHFDVLFRTRE